MTSITHHTAILRARATELQPELDALCRALQCIPEPGFDVPLTQQAVLDALARMVGAAKLLSELQHDLAGSVVFMFQLGEEAGGGAPRMITEGVLNAAGSRVAAVRGH